MKYKDLRVGDWFTICDDPTPYIRVKTSDGELNDVYLGDSDNGFGSCLLLNDNPELEVHFLSKLNVSNPYFRADASAIDKHPLCQFFQIDFITGEPLILFTTYVDGNYTILLNSANYTGILDKNLKIGNRANVKAVPDISLSFPEIGVDPCYTR